MSEKPAAFTAVKRVLSIIEHLTLILLLIATVWAIGQELVLMVHNGEVHLSDLLLLFIYLEVLAMIGIYYEQHQLPVRYPIYIAMAALSRYIILDSKDLSWQGLLGIGATLLLLALTVLIHRYGHITFPYENSRMKQGKAMTDDDESMLN